MSATTETTSAIRAQDFSKSTRDVNRDKWTNDKLYALIRGLDGRRVILIADRQTGFAEFDVKILGYHQHAGWWMVECERSNGSRINYWAPTVGDTIVLMPAEYGDPGHNAKWDALKIHTMEALTVTTSPRGFAASAV
jgi:hypothetical protein